MSGEPVAKGLQGARRRKVLLGLTIALFALLLILYWLRAVFGPLLLSLGLAYVLDPLVRKGQALGLSRTFAVSTVFVLFLVVGGLSTWFLVRQAIDLVGAAAAKGGILDVFAKNLVKLIEETLPNVRFAERFADQLKEVKFEAVKSIAETALGLVKQFGKGLQGLIDIISIFVLLPIYLFYLMLDLPRILDWSRVHLPGRHRRRIVSVAQRIHQGLAAFLRGRLLIAVLKGLVTAVGLTFCGLPYSFLVGMIAGLLSIFPFVGAALGLVVAVILTFAKFSPEPVGHLIGVVSVFIGAEVVEGYVLTPWILGDKLDMHPVTVVVSLVAWGSIFGLFGILVAIPLTIVVKILFQEFLLPPIEMLASEEQT